MTDIPSLQETAPADDQVLPWPLDGLVYVIMFTGPTMGAAAVGAIGKSVSGVLLGLLVGASTTLVNGLLFDRCFEPLMVRWQVIALRPWLRLLINVAGFSWAVSICCAMPMIVTLLLLDPLGWFHP